MYAVKYVLLPDIITSLWQLKLYCGYKYGFPAGHLDRLTIRIVNYLRLQILWNDR